MCVSVCACVSGFLHACSCWCHVGACFCAGVGSVRDIRFRRKLFDKRMNTLACGECNFECGVEKSVWVSAL